MVSTISLSKAEPAWWNDNWNFRRPITIFDIHPENYHLKIVVPRDNDMQSDYDDLRFLENGASGELSYWIENYTTDNVTVWVKRLENADNTIYLYYGNPNATSASSWENTILPYVDSQVTSSADWQARYRHTFMVFDGKIWVIGGHNGNNNLSDVWCSADGASWTQATDNADWSPRRDHTSVVFDNKMWVLGGADSSVWYSTDGENWSLATSSPGWSGRWGHSSVVFDGRMWVFGGYDGTYENDVWYSADGENWFQATSSADWSARHSHTSVVFDNKMWITGGYCYGNHKNDVWYSTDGENWFEATSGADWIPRRDHTSVVYDHRIWVIGGNGEAWVEYTDDVWYSADGENWFLATAHGDWSPRYGHASTVFNEKVWVLGGYDLEYKNDVWRLLRKHVSPEPVVNVGEGEIGLILVSPDNGARTDNNTPTFDWENERPADNFQIQVDNDNGFSLPEIDNVVTISEFTPAVGLADNLYYWRVRLERNSVYSDWSEVWTVWIDTIISAPSLESPPVNHTTNDSTPSFDWSDVSDPSGIEYTLEIIGTFTKTGLTSSNYTLTSGEALSNGTYTWHVGAIDGAGNENWSDNRSLTVSVPSPPPEKTSTSLSIDPSSFELTLESSRTLTATLKDVDNNSLAGKTITWSTTAGSLSATSSTTDNFGQVTVTYTAPAVDNQTSVTVMASFAGDSSYNASEGSSTGTISPVPPAPTSLAITPSSFIVGSGNNLVLTVTLKSENDTPLAGKLISWSATAGNIAPSNTTTDSSGQVSATYIAPVVSAQISATITASFVGDSSHSASSATSGGTVLTQKTVEWENLVGNLEEQISDLEISVENENLQVLENAFVRGDLGAYITIKVVAGTSEIRKEFQHQDIQLEVEISVGEKVEVTVSSEVENGKTFVLNIDNHALPVLQLDRIIVLYDNEEIGPADGYEDVLDPTNENVPEHLILMGGRGIQVLVSVPSFTTHTITIALIPELPPAALNVVLIIGIAVLVAGIIITLAVKLPRKRAR